MRVLLRSTFKYQRLDLRTVSLNIMRLALEHHSFFKRCPENLIFDFLETHLVENYSNMTNIYDMNILRTSFIFDKF
jgi:hypothetical protein